MINLELGCGPKNKRIHGFIGLDIDIDLCPDIVCDLENGAIPLKDNSVKYIWADYVMEHIDNVMEIIQEIWRVCANGSVVYIGVPHYAWEGAAKDPTHKTLFSEDSYRYWDSRDTSVPHYGNTSKFDLMNVEIRYASWATEEDKQNARKLRNVIEKLGFWLKVVK